VPVVLIDWYWYDSVTKSVVTIIDTTWGNIYSAPDHVVAFAVGSWLSPTEQAQLANINTIVTTDIPADLTIINDWVKKASKLIPHSTDL
jgi:hypothetical protein